MPLLFAYARSKYYKMFHIKECYCSTSSSQDRPVFTKRTFFSECTKYKCSCSTFPNCIRNGHCQERTCLPGASCSKLMTTLVNVVKISNINITKYIVIFCLKNVRIFCTDSHFFPTKNNSVFDNVVDTYLSS